jgi:hypothetical protein
VNGDIREWTGCFIVVFSALRLTPIALLPTSSEDLINLFLTEWLSKEC